VVFLYDTQPEPHLVGAEAVTGKPRHRDHLLEKRIARILSSNTAHVYPDGGNRMKRKIAA